MRVDSQSAFLLHSRPYQDNKLILDLFSPDFGKVSCVASAPRGKRRRVTGKPQPFSRLSLSWFGKSELKTSRSWEVEGPTFLLSGRALLSGLYLNELLLRTLPKEDAFVDLFSSYQATLASLAISTDIEPLLRQFEMVLLSELGYGLTLTTDSNSGDDIQMNVNYRFYPEDGFHRVGSNFNENPQLNVFRGQHILAMAEQDFSSLEVRRAAKKIMRVAIDSLLGHRPLKTRELFRQGGQ